MFLIWSGKSAGVNNVRVPAQRLLRIHGTCQPSLDDLCSMIAEHGYEIIDFDPKEETMGLISEELSLTTEILNQHAFVYAGNSIKLVFVQEHLPAEDKRIALAHELGHIVLGHMTMPGKTDIQEEHEANEFVHFLLHPPCHVRFRLWMHRHRRAIILSGAAVMLLVVLAGVLQHKAVQASYHDEYLVTTGGSKYHRQTCMVIRNKRNVRRLTEEEVLSGRYTPCQVCMPEE